MSRARCLPLLAVLWGISQWCWTGAPEVSVLKRRAALLGTVGGFSAPACAEEVYQTVTPTGDPYLERVDSRTGDFSIQLPSTWQKEFDSYAGRLIMSVDPEELAKLQQNQENEMVTLRCARLPLPALLRSARYMPREGDESRSNWKEVALGDVTGATVAEWLMRAGQQALATSVGMELPQVDINIVDFQIEDGSDQSILSWHATTKVEVSSVRPVGQDPADQSVQGLGGKTLVPLSQAFTQGPAEAPRGDVPPLSTFGRAILRKGVVTFAVAQAPVNRLDASYKGPIGKQYLDYIVQSLKLAQAAADAMSKMTQPGALGAQETEPIPEPTKAPALRKS